MRSILACAFLLAACHHTSRSAPDGSPPDTPLTAPDAPVDAATGPIDCAQPIACPAPSAGRMTVCGQILDLQTSQPVHSSNPMGVCTLGATDGPCMMWVHAYDADAFAVDPQGAVELPTSDITVDECGHYRVANIDPQGAPEIAISIAPLPAVVGYRTAAITIPFASDQAVSSVSLYSMRKTTDELWTAAAGLSGQSLVDRGVLVGIFLHGQTPVAGVQVVRGGVTNPTSHFYFSDATATLRRTIAPAQPSSGANGAVVTTGQGGQTTYTGTGAETADCTWPTVMGSEPPGVALVESITEVRSANPSQACP